MKRRWPAATLIGVTVFTAVTHAAVDGARRHDRLDSAYRALAAEPAFSCVGAIRDGERHLGSAVLIAPGWMLTAAHVVSAREGSRTKPFAPDSVVVRFDAGERRVAEIFLHPGYWPDGVPNAADPLARKGIDVALLRLETPIDRIAPAMPAASDPAPGTPVVFVGFGTSGTAQSVVAAPEPGGTKRAGTNVIDQVGGRIGGREIPPFLLAADFDAPEMPLLSRTGDAAPTELEYMPVGGDSGGGVFARVDGTWRLAGLFVTGTINVNNGAADKGIYGSVAYATSVASLARWIDQIREQ